MFSRNTYNTKQNKTIQKTKIKRADNPAIMKAAHTEDTKRTTDQARQGFEKRNKDIEDEMKGLVRRIGLWEGEGEKSHAMREDLMELEKQLKGTLNNWKAWEIIQNIEVTVAEKDKKEREIINEDEMEKLNQEAKNKEETNIVSQSQKNDEKNDI